MKKLLIPFLFLSPSLLWAEMVQPPYENSDPAVSENFRKVYYDVDEINRQLAAGTSGQMLVSDGQGSFYWGAASGTFVDIPSAQTITGAKTFSSPAGIPIGTISLPGLYFSGDPNTGLYQTTGDSIRFTCGGANPLQLTADAVYPIEPIWNVAGAVDAPSYSFDGDPDNGAYYIGTNNWGLTAGGTKGVDLKATGVAILGTTTNDSGTAGFYGEYVSSITTGYHLLPTSGQYGNLLSISLTAGDWNVDMCFSATVNGATVTDYQFGLGTATGNNAAGMVLGDNSFQVAGATGGNGGCISGVRVSISGTTTYYFKYFSEYSVATPKTKGRISARRMR